MWTLQLTVLLTQSTMEVAHSMAQLLRNRVQTCQIAKTVFLLNNKNLNVIIHYIIIIIIIFIMIIIIIVTISSSSSSWQYTTKFFDVSGNSLCLENFIQLLEIFRVLELWNPLFLTAPQKKQDLFELKILGTICLYIAEHINMKSHSRKT
jgi:hypothetical protein